MLKDYLEHSFNAILILNEDDQVILSNKKADQMLNITNENRNTIFGSKIFELVEHHGSSD